MTVGVLSKIAAQDAPRTIEAGAMTLDAQQYAKFVKTAKPTQMESIFPGDVILVGEIGGVAVVRTVRKRTRLGKSISLDGFVKGASIEVLAIAAANFGDR